MILDFEKMPKFREHAYRILELIPVWALAHGVSEKAIIQQIPTAYAWMLANKPRKRITHFLNNWMVNAKKFGNLVEKKAVVSPTVRFAPTAESELLTWDDIQKAKAENVKN
jgi:hypothetical protein